MYQEKISTGFYMGRKNYQQDLADVEKALQINLSNDTAYRGRSTISVP